MRKCLILLLFVALEGCFVDPVKDPDPLPYDSFFELEVPADFNWSCINQPHIIVNFKHNGAITTALDNTLVELYDNANNLLDLLTIQNGLVDLNPIIPATVDMLKLKVMATGESVQIDAGASTVDYIVENISAKVVPKMGNAGIEIQGSSTYSLFENSWPLKDDFDFNDVVVKTTCRWQRNAENFITEIAVVCNIEAIDVSLDWGLGFELFGLEGHEIYYLGDVMRSVNEAEKDENVKNGIVAVSSLKELEVGTTEFRITLNENELKNFLFIPYLFRLNNNGIQIRPFGAPPTQAQDMGLFSFYDDASPTAWRWDQGSKFAYPLSGEAAFFRSAENYPWAIQFIFDGTFQSCREGISIVSDYPTFQDWAESGGKSAKDWYNHPL
nr:LruC domain-containing protein [uncultured Draconibacterium sp.]